MAGDWIKMRCDLRTHPKVVRISSALKADRLRVIGGLHAVWSLFDAHSSDGFLDGYTPESLDDMIGWPGFTEAMIKIEWLSTDGNSLCCPRFDEHNGQSAKRRAQETERKRLARIDASVSVQDVDNLSASEADEMRSREEKRREESKPTNPNGLVVASDAVGKTKADCPHKEIIALYHEILPQCPAVRDWTTNRATLLRARWNEEPRRQNLNYWRDVFIYIGKCDFLVGKKNGRNGKPFFAGLAWIVKSDNFVKIREGNYANEQ